MENLLDTLRRINNNYGRGDVVRIARDNNGGVAVIRFGWVGKGQKPFEETRRFSISNNRVRFRGVTRTIGYRSK